MKRRARRSRFISGWVAALAVALQLLWLLMDQPQPPQILRISPAGSYGEGPAAATQRTNIVLDDLREKYTQARRVEFHVHASRDNSIFVLATGVQAHRPAGWQTLYEESRGEIWRLKSGVAREVCVERPEGETWRAYVRYGTEMKGPQLWKWQFREAWRDGSFSNWTGRAWGGGRFSGSNELFSEEFAE